MQGPLKLAAEEWPDSAGRNAPGSTQQEGVWLTNTSTVCLQFTWLWAADSDPTPSLVISERWPAALEVAVSKVMGSGTSCAWERSCKCILWYFVAHFSAAETQDREGSASAAQGQENIWPYSCCLHLSSYFQTKSQVCKSFLLKARIGGFAKINSGFQSLPGSLEHKGWLRAVTHHQEAARGGPPYLLSYLGCGSQQRGGVGRGACRWENRGKVKYYDSFHFFGKRFGNSHPFLCPSQQLELFS